MTRRARRNSFTRSGVHSGMRRALILTLFSLTAFAQAPQREPIELALEAFWKARTEGRFSEAASKREEARSLLDRSSVDDARFGNWANSAMQLYQQSGMTAKARAVAEAALARTSRLGDHPNRMTLLMAMAESWHQAGNLLKAVGYMELAAAIAEKTPPPASPQAAPARVGVAMGRLSLSPMPIGVPGSTIVTGNRWYYGGAGVQDPTYIFQRLADLYRQLGRPEAAARTTAKVNARLQGNDMALAQFYDRQGQPAEAIASYQKHAAQAASPQERAAALQSLANHYAFQQERPEEAIAALRQSIALLEETGKPELRNQALWARSYLAQALHRAGKIEEADQVFRQALSESQKMQGQETGILTNYANHLASTKRGAEAETVLKDHLTSRSKLQPWEEAQIYHGLAHVARISGDSKRAEEYFRTAREKEPGPAGQTGQIQIGKLLQRAQSAVNQSNLDEAFSLTLQAIDAAPAAADREQLAWLAPNLASMMVGKDQAAKADQLFQRLLALVQSWSADNLQPLITVSQHYARYLLHRRDRTAEAPAAIEQYRSALLAAHGADAGQLADVYQLNIELANLEGSTGKAILHGQELLALQESLSGNTSEPYMNALENVARQYATAGDTVRALPLRLQAIAIGDLVMRPNDPRRGYTRREVAMLLAAQERFDEAERLAAEAVTIGESLRPRQPDQFGQTLEQIRAMRSRKP